MPLELALGLSSPGCGQSFGFGLRNAIRAQTGPDKHGPADTIWGQKTDEAGQKGSSHVAQVNYVHEQGHETPLAPVSEPLDPVFGDFGPFLACFGPRLV